MLYYTTAYKLLGLDGLNRYVISVIIRARVQFMNPEFYLQIVKKSF